MLTEDMPLDGGCALDIAQTDGYLIVTESVREVAQKINKALNDSELSSHDPEQSLWIQLTAAADAEEEVDRRPTWVKADHIVRMTYISSEYLDKWENEI